MENKEKLWSMLSHEKKLPANAGNYLMGLCQQYPRFKVPFMVLSRVQADLFNGDLWVKADQLIENNRAILQLFFRKPDQPEYEEPVQGVKKLSSDEIRSKQLKIIENFLNNRITFTEPSPKNI